MSYLIGIDDTDSRFGHCTTHLGFLVACELSRLGCAFSTYPRLVRLNPNIPFKTRGNAAVCIEFQVGSDLLRDEAFIAAQRLLEQEADVANGANSAMVMVPKDAFDDLAFCRQIYQRAVNGVVSYRSVAASVSKMGIHHRLLGNGMGVVGAVASLGFSPAFEDHTYELISYRKPENCGTPRAVDPQSVKDMESESFPDTFNSFDHESRRVLIAPTGPDPVHAGVRGDSPGTVLKAFQRIRIGEEALGHMVYATNQCTDAHLKSKLSLPLSAFSAGWVEGPIVSSKPSQGGHLMLELGADGSTVNCMVYEPSGDLMRVARLLSPGDMVRISGGVRRASSKNPVVVNVERIDVASTSSGNRKREAFKAGASRVVLGAYLPSPRAQRHLTKQLIRYGREIAGEHPLIEGWIKPTSKPRLEAPRVSARLARPRKA